LSRTLFSLDNGLPIYTAQLSFWCDYGQTCLDWDALRIYN
jgi:hypothetical protein